MSYGGRVLGETLQQAIAAKGISYRELARRIEVDIATVSRWMRDESVPIDEHVPALARELAIPRKDLETLVADVLAQRDGRTNRDRLEDVEKQLLATNKRLKSVEAKLNRLIATIEAASKEATEVTPEMFAAIEAAAAKRG